MKRNLQFIVFVVFVAACCGSARADTAEQLQKLREFYETNLEKIEKDVSEEAVATSISYMGALTRLQKKIQAEGDLDGWQAVQKV